MKELNNQIKIPDFYIRLLDLTVFLPNYLIQDHHQIIASKLQKSQFNPH